MALTIGIYEERYKNLFSRFVHLFSKRGGRNQMATAEERMQILKMVENKQITAEDGAKLLAALDAKGQAGEPNVPSPPLPRKADGSASV